MSRKNREKDPRFSCQEKSRSARNESCAWIRNVLFKVLRVFKKHRGSIGSMYEAYPMFESDVSVEYRMCQGCI